MTADEQEIARLYHIELEHQGCAHLRERDNAELTAQRDAALAGGMPGARRIEEWRVTGQPDGWAAYDVVFSPLTTPHVGDPETAARECVTALQGLGVGWLRGPQLHCRVVVHTPWEPAADG